MAPGPSFPSNIERILAQKKKRVGTWVRKSEVEIERIKKEISKSAFSPAAPISIFIISFFACLVTMNIMGHSKLDYCMGLSIIAFFITYVFQVIKGRKFADSPRIKICRKCLHEDWLGLKVCHCGGKLEPPEYYQFIEQDN